jgi:hypothetical protein
MARRATSWLEINCIPLEQVLPGSGAIMFPQPQLGLVHGCSQDRQDHLNSMLNLMVSSVTSTSTVGVASDNLCDL